ncbi:MAG: SDR family NAD(P)-dependent oxidoreductase [Terracidiphilus sp.]|jgi:NAD(P)-dependent dehydrogenase (short-subunit alcohol dehydrogenase family)
MPIETDEKTPRKIAIVTGGSRGIGRNTVESLAKRGVNTIFTYHAQGRDAETVVAAVKDAGAQAVALRLDADNISSLLSEDNGWIDAERIEVTGGYA